MNLEPENIFYGVLAFSWIEFFWGSYLSHRQRKIYKKHVEVPDEVKGLLDEETFTKARLYALDKSNFGAFQGIFSQVLSTVFMVYFAFKFLWDVSGEFYSQDLYVHQVRLGLHQVYFLIHTWCFVVKKEPKYENRESKFNWHDLSPIFLATMFLNNLKVFLYPIEVIKTRLVFFGILLVV